MRLRVVGTLVLAAVGATGCQTAVGNYFANRARDFGECWRLQLGGGFGAGASVEALGLCHVGVGLELVEPKWGVGWIYGDGYAFHAADTAKTGEAYFPVTLMLQTHWSDVGVHASDIGEHRHHSCPMILPAVFGRAGGADRPSRRLWTSEALEKERWAHIHAFDVEVSACAGLVAASAGFSPGEFLDFVLGWFGVDIAGDDRALERPR